MNQFEETFHKSIRMRGGRYNLEGGNLTVILEEIKEMGNSLIEEIREMRPHFPSTHIDFINNPTFNACAFKQEDMYFIGINIGVVQVLEKLFNYIMAHPNLMVGIGDASHELEQDIGSSLIVTNHDYLRLFSNYDTEISSPVNEERRSFAKTLCAYALEFLILHEYGHIVSGHVDYFQNKRSSSFIFELNSREKSGLFMQTLEMDADSYATTRCAQRMIYIHTQLKGFYNKLGVPSISFREYFKQRYYSIYFVFRLFGEVDYDLSALEENSHPASGFRQYFLLLVLHSAFVAEGQEELITETELIEVLKEVATECEQALKTISEKIFTPAPIRIVATPEGNSHIIKIMENWKNVRPLLEPYSMATLPPIENWNVEN
ncbi:hypothetical protein [Bacillus cereus group sp. BfR-BA-01524]|uniref:hypothetical protein n=1 Tax=Bacillus cereus group sp. BfR-BA-01524 TaxID=2920372 RepID=UPI001F5ACBA5